jgi:methylglutaconyl-CoA hydratase
MTTQDEVLCELRGQVLWMTINRPAHRNAMSEGVMQGLSAALARASQDREILVAVLTGTGDRAFCAGADLKHDSSFLEFDYSDCHTSYGELLRQANRFEKPLIARVNGHVMAGGMGLLSMCDMAVAADDVRFGLPEVKIGAFPMQVASVMQHLIPRRKFVEMCLTGEPITAAEALEFDLVNHVVPRTELDAKLDWLIARLTDKSPAAIRRGKNALRAIAEMTFEQSISFTEAQLGTVVLMKDAIEGIAAFNEKRPPRWAGK